MPWSWEPAARLPAVGRSAYDWVEYGESGRVRPFAEVVCELQPLLEGVELEMVSFRAVASTGIAWRDWVELARLVRDLAATRPDVHGIVITHGTASLEDTAWFLELVLQCRIPVVLVGAQRPPNTAGSDAAPNLRAALAVAAAPAARDLGVLVVMDNHIYGARDAQATSNFALTRSAGEFGLLGRVDADGTVVPRRRPAVPKSRSSALAAASRDAPPRVDLALSYAGADGTAIDAFVRSGASAIISAGMPPGRCTPEERAALREAAAAGVLVVQSSRAPRGAVVAQGYNRADGTAGRMNLAPNKLRILLMVGLSAGLPRAAIGEMLHDF